MNLQSREATAKRAPEESWDLRGTIAAELASGSRGFTGENVRLLRHHGIFQQDNRDHRHGWCERAFGRYYDFMVRIRATGGRLTARQMLGVLVIADGYGDGRLRVTSRQGLQIEGIVKSSLRSVVRGLNDLGLGTAATGGAFNCNVMCCPAPNRHDRIHDQLQFAAQRISAQLTGRFPEYEEIWLRERCSEIREPSCGPMDGRRATSLSGDIVLPHKFKVALATAQDNCTDVYSQDVGLLAVTEGGSIIGYNVLVGGGMGAVLGVKGRLPTLAKPVAFVGCDDLLPLVSAIACVYRQHGNEPGRAKARMRYLVQDWGLDRFKRVVEERFGRPLESPRQVEVVGCEDHLDWQRQGDGDWFLGIPVDLGAIRDTDHSCLKSALREIAERFGGNVRLTPQQNILLCDIKPSERHEIECVLAQHNVPQAGRLSNVRRLAIACPGLPKCAAAITQSHRTLSGLIDALESEVARLGLSGERFTIRVTGCPFGCTRSYLADIAIVGRTVDRSTRQEKFALFVGGGACGRRLNMLYKDLVPADQIISTLRPLLQSFKTGRHTEESLGGFCCRKGIDALKQMANEVPSEDAAPADNVRPCRVNGDPC